MPPISQYISNYGFIACAKEATAGTPVASTDYFEITSESLAHDPGTMPVKAIRGTRAENTTYVLAEAKLDGNVVLPFGPTIGMRLFAATFGTDYVQGSTPASATTLSAAAAAGANTVTLTSATGYATGGYLQLKSVATPAVTEVHKILSISTNTVTFQTGETLQNGFASGDTVNVVVAPFTHTLSPKETGLPTLTIEKNLGGLTSLQWAGAMVSKAQLKLSTKAEVSGTFDLLAAGEAQIAPTVPTYTTETPYALANISASKFGAADGTIKSLDLTVDNGATGEYTFAGKNLPNFIYTASRKVTGTVAYLLQNMTDFNNALAGTAGDLNLVLSKGAGQSCTIDMPNVVWGKPSIPLKLGDLIRVSMPFTAYFLPGTSTDISATVVNALWLPYC